MSGILKNELDKINETIRTCSNYIKESLEKPELNDCNKAKALELLRSEIKPILLNILNLDVDGDDLKYVSAVLGDVQLSIAKLAYEVEKLDVALTNLEECHEIIKNYETLPEFIMTAVELHYLQGNINMVIDTDKSKNYFEKGEQLYLDFIKLKIPPVAVENSLRIITNRCENNSDFLENIYYDIVFNLAQIYADLNEALKSAVYCHARLEFELKKKDLNRIEWALNSAALGQVFIENNGFKQARHHLAASLCVMDEHKKIIDSRYNSDEKEKYEEALEEYNYRIGDIAKCWMKYGLCLLETSKKRLLDSTDDIDKNAPQITDLALLDLSDEKLKVALKNLTFHSLNTTEYENEITDKYLLTMEDARKVFLNAQKWCGKAQDYFTLDRFASDYILIALDHSNLYYYLSFFEENTENQSKMLKRRLTMLESLSKSINPQYYLTYCRQIWSDLTQICLDMRHAKMDKFNENNSSLNKSQIKKINDIVQKGVTYCMLYKKSFDNMIGTDQMKDEEYKFIEAHFKLSSLYTLFIPDSYDHRDVFLNCAQNVLDELIKYIDKYPPKSEDVIRLLENKNISYKKS